MEGTWYVIKYFIKKNNFYRKYLAYKFNLFVYLRTEDYNFMKQQLEALLIIFK